MPTKTFGRNSANVGSSDTTFISQFDDQVRDGNAVFLADIGGPETRILYRFDFGSEIPAGSTITNVTMQVYCTSTFGTDAQTFYRLVRAWSPTTARWSEASSGVAWGTAGANNTTTDITASPAFTQNASGVVEYFSFTDPALVTLVQGWIDGTFPNYGIRHSSSAYIQWALNGAGDTGRPQLTVTYTPPAVTTGVPVAWFAA